METIYDSFREKLKWAMLTANISNVKLAKDLNVDASLISRYRTGSRSPKSNAGLAKKLCNVLLSRIEAVGKTDELCDMIGASLADVDSKKLEKKFYEWLINENNVESQAIDAMIGKFKAVVGSGVNIELMVPTEEDMKLIPKDKKNIYVGIEGIREASTRFLADVYVGKEEKVYLYSDQKMDWIFGDEKFSMMWLKFMLGILKNGTEVIIIHNIDRQLKEMVTAISGWMPLYMAGKIKSFYLDSKAGNRFSHTIFLCPGKSAITSFFPANDEVNAVYSFSTDKIIADSYAQMYESMLSKGNQLMYAAKEEVSQDEITNEDDMSYSFDDGRGHISVYDDKAVFSYVIEDARVSYIFLHPSMIVAFRAYIEAR